jgi:hypothetical protein
VTNAAGGSFTVQNGRAFATSGPFANAGNLTVVSGRTLTVGGTPAGLGSWWQGNAADAIDGNTGTLQNGATFAPVRSARRFASTARTTTSTSETPPTLTSPAARTRPKPG